MQHNLQRKHFTTQKNLKRRKKRGRNNRNNVDLRQSIHTTMITIAAKSLENVRQK